MVSLLDRAENEGLTIRACANLVAKSRSHGTFVGTVEGSSITCGIGWMRAV